MKVKITLDVTPEEARAALGLPDVTGLHEIYLGKMKGLLEKGVTPDLVGDVIKSWSSMGGAGMAIAQQLFGQLGTSLTGGAKSKGDKS